MATIEIAGERFHHAAVGAGRPFVFQHGLGADVSQTLRFGGGLPGWQTLALDCRGHGATEAGIDFHKLSFAQFADDLAAWLDRVQPGTARVVVGGISMGAGVALAFAAAHPERVAGLVLVRPAWLDQPSPANLRWFPLAARLLAEHAPKEAARLCRLDPEFAVLAAQSPAAADSLLAQFHRPQARARAAVLAALPASVPAPDLATVGTRLRGIPTLIVVNGRDPVHPATLGEALAATLPTATLRRITPKTESEGRHHAELTDALGAFLPLSVEHFTSPLP